MSSIRQHPRAPRANPKLYRASVGGQSPAYSYGFTNGHGPNGPNMFCEACHGPTHAEWPVSPSSGTYVANDNQTAIQLQGHTGLVSNCSTCHGSQMDSVATLDGPHGLHPIGDNTPFASSNVHRQLFTNSSYNDTDYRNKCETCHGGTTRGSSCGTVLSAAKAARSLKGTNVPAGKPIGCTVCHNPDPGVTCP
jgi:hypothetical protein